MPLGHVLLAQDGFETEQFTKNPEFSFFAQETRHNDPFSLEDVEQYFSTDYGFGKRSSCPLQPNADFVTTTYLVAGLPPLPAVASTAMPESVPHVWRYRPDAGHRLIRSIEIQVNGRVLQKLRGDSIHLHHKLRGRRSKNVDSLIGNRAELLQFSERKEGVTLYVPIPFWFALEGGDALPIGRLAGARVQINVEFASLRDIVDVGPTHCVLLRETVVRLHLYQDIFQGGVKVGVFMGFDAALRRMYYNAEPGTDIRFDPAQSDLSTTRLVLDNGAYMITDRDATRCYTPDGPPRESGMVTRSNIEMQTAYMLVTNAYLGEAAQSGLRHAPTMRFVIPQTQVLEFADLGSRKQFLSLAARNLVYEILWVTTLQRDNDPFLFRPLVSKFAISFNGCEVVSQRSGLYAELLQLMQHYHGHTSPDRPRLCVYGHPVALNPESAARQPSGQINMDKIEKAVLYVEMDPIVDSRNLARLVVHIQYYNVLEIAPAAGAEPGTEGVVDVRLLF